MSNEPTSGAALIAAERQRQVDVEGWTPEHDRTHGPYELEAAALAYVRSGDSPRPAANWPWAAMWWKPKDRLRNLIRAGALFQAAGEASELVSSMRYWGMRDVVAAEIDRLQTAAVEVSS